MNIDEILNHTGTKGMKWGVRKSKVPKQGPSGDAKDAHRSFVKAKVSGSEALSNKELQSLNNRLNLEKNYNSLSYNPGPVKKMLDAIFKQGKTVNEVLEFADSRAGKLIAKQITTKKKSIPVVPKP